MNVDVLLNVCFCILQTISLTVMVLEATGDMQYVLPLMLTVMAARWTGNLFTEGIYDMHIHTRKLNYLDEDESVSRLVQLHDLTVSDIMSKRPFYMLPVMRVGEFYDILTKAKHNCFPVGELQSFCFRFFSYSQIKHSLFPCNDLISGVGRFEHASWFNTTEDIVHTVKTQGIFTLQS